MVPVLVKFHVKSDRIILMLEYKHDKRQGTRNHRQKVNEFPEIINVSCFLVEAVVRNLGAEEHVDHQTTHLEQVGGSAVASFQQSVRNSLLEYLWGSDDQDASREAKNESANAHQSEVFDYGNHASYHGNPVEYDNWVPSVLFNNLPTDCSA